jgi:hypothetical protein
MGSTHRPFLRHFGTLFLLDLGVLNVVAGGRSLPPISLRLDGLGFADAFSLFRITALAPCQLGISCALHLLSVLPFAAFRPSPPTNETAVNQVTNKQR